MIVGFVAKSKDIFPISPLLFLVAILFALAKTMFLFVSQIVLGLILYVSLCAIPKLFVCWHPGDFMNLSIYGSP